MGCSLILLDVVITRTIILGGIMRAPNFWKDKGLLSNALLPASAIYALLAKMRSCSASEKKVPASVICVGNLVAGGAGKTPVALFIGEMLKSLGKNAHYLSRGYKSCNKGVTQVDLSRHSAKDVGDEPMLLAEVLPTWVAKDRVKGAEAAASSGAEIIVMDDGLQNPYLHKDVSLLVIDGHYGFGNERIIPAGPLRERLEKAVKRVSAVIVIGDDKYDVLRHIPSDIPVIHAKVRHSSAADFLKDKQVVAFCGIARPLKFYRTLRYIGCSVRKYISYPDHHYFKHSDVQFLREKAKELEAVLVTTEKDYVRLPLEMRAEVQVVPIELVFDDIEALRRVVLA